MVTPGDPTCRQLFRWPGSLVVHIPGTATPRLPRPGRLRSVHFSRVVFVETVAHGRAWSRVVGVRTKIAVYLVNSTFPEKGTNSARLLAVSGRIKGKDHQTVLVTG